MISYLKLSNFMSFRDIMWDLRGANGIPKKMAFLYGENGSGKSNLMFSMLFLSRTFNTLPGQARLKLMEAPEITGLLNSIGDDDMRKDIVNRLMKSRFPTLPDLIQEYKTLGCTAPMKLELGFYLDGKKGSYSLAFSDDEVIAEKLTFQIAERAGALFSIDQQKAQLSPTIFFDPDYKQELKEDIEKYWGKHTFASILFNEFDSKNKKFVRSRIKNSLFQVLDWLNTFSVLCKHSHGQTSKVAIPYDFMQQLDSGDVKEKENPELKSFERALNAFFTQLYSDIKGVYYRLTPSNNGYHYELTFKKQIGGEILDIPLSKESTGTEKLVDLFPYLFSSILGNTVLIDEIDSGVHDLLMCQIIGLMKDSLNGQFLATTHNTLLMRQLPKESVYIIRSDSNGGKEITCISDYAFRTQKTNSVQSKYLNGDYEGVPFVGFLDLDEIVQDVVEQLSPHAD